jgi:hypothetical protein
MAYRPQPGPHLEAQGDAGAGQEVLAGLVFIFLVILAVFTIRFGKDKQDLEAAKRELRDPIMTRQKILEDLQNVLLQSGVRAEVFAKEGVISFGDEGIHFSQSEAHPTKEKIANVAKIAAALGRILPCYGDLSPEGAFEVTTPPWCQTAEYYPDYSCDRHHFGGKIETIMIEGHTDPTPVKPTASYPDNLTLSAMRAGNVWNLLKTCQPKLEHLINRKKHPLFAVSGYAFQRPAFPDPKDPRNRRIDIRFVMDSPEGIHDRPTASRKEILDSRF